MSSITFILLYQILVHVVSANWGNPNSGQYHIQTDEGPERYFRYQTDNGQFRKEKRLADGTVIGTNAWIDGFGYLRQSDYIADHQGYRILKSKTVFVGKDRPIEVNLFFNEIFLCNFNQFFLSGCNERNKKSTSKLWNISFQ